MSPLVHILSSALHQSLGPSKGLAALVHFKMAQLCAGSLLVTQLFVTYVALAALAFYPGMSGRLHWLPAEPGQTLMQRPLQCKRWMLAVLILSAHTANA